MNLSNLSISVENFFSNANWLGITKSNSSESLLQENPLFSLTLESKVEDFFTYNNWQGLEITESIPADNFGEGKVPQVLSLTMSVSDFFSLMEWKGKPNIAPNPSQPPSKSSPNNSNHQMLKIDDLSKLF